MRAYSLDLRQEELKAALVSAMKLVTSFDIRGWFNYCGYSVAPG